MKILKIYLLLLFFSLSLLCRSQRVANYISNGSFEQYYTCSPYLTVKNWTSPDSLCSYLAFLNVCNNSVPKGCCGIFQYPHSGKGYMELLVYYPPSPPLKKFYAKNRMKSNLQAGKSYCVKFYVNIYNGSTHGIDGIGAYFGGSEIDTITHCNVPLTYIIPQVHNPQGNIITDTLNWLPITGTFTANGTEKYVLLGNFLSDANTSTIMINPTYLPAIATEITIDDVSCIEVDLPAYAGRDTTIYIGGSAYIGRESDFAIDTGCVWYQLPNNTMAIDTVSGMWVTPNSTGTYTYVVRQELECSAVKWDTVVVTVRDYDVGTNELTMENLQLTIYPNPADEVINVEFLVVNNEVEVKIINVLGELIKNSTLTTKNSQIDVSGLENGMYMICLSDEKKRSVMKKLVITR